jgi:hypothetical protein
LDRLRLTSLDLSHFKAFEHFTVSFGPTAVLVGPNNAGKSTVVTALRAIAQMMGTARRLRATYRVFQGDHLYWGHPFTTEQVGLDADNLRWESAGDAVSLRATFSDNARLHATWPEADSGREPYFVALDSNRKSVREPSIARDVLTKVGVVPSLAPLERRETLLDTDYVRLNVGGRLASRHFRNQLFLARNDSLGDLDWAGWSSFANEWLPELTMRDPELTDSGLDIFYRELHRPSWKELVWAGDGFQVFVQALFHLYRVRHMDVVVLDEPDVYLHADLQRRLMQAAQSLGCQVIVATHSSEVAAEVGSAAVVWMDRTRKRSVRAPDDTLLDQIAGALGSQFNLRLARVLRARLALFVEGNDAGVLKRVARTIGAKRFTAEAGLALVPIEGVSNLRKLDGFAWLNKNLLQGAVEGFVLVDRDYHSPDYIGAMVTDMKVAGLECLVWERKELESYLLVPAALARLSGVSVEKIDELLAGITQNMYEDVLFQHMATAKQDFPDKRKLADQTLGKDFRWLKEAWKDPGVRLSRCPPKDVLSELNGTLQNMGKQAISVERLATSLKADEVPDEMKKLIHRIEKRLAATSRVAAG